MGETGISEPWFETAHFDEMRSARTLSPEVEEIVDDYARDGYVKIDLGFDQELLDQVTRETKALYGRSRRVQDMWRRSEAVRSLAATPKVLSLLNALYGRRAFPFQTLNFPVGTQQGTHSDTYHFNSFPPRFMCGVWVALEEVDEDNGPLHYYPGSHKLPVLGTEDIGSEDKKAYQEYVDTLLVQNGFTKELGVLKRGEAILWSANLFHGGDRIKDPSRTRLSQVTHYYFDDCLYYTPLASSQDQVTLRAPYDFATGRFVKNRILGKPLRAPLRTVVSAYASNWLKRTPDVPASAEKLAG